MAQRVLVAGATGAVGRPLCLLLRRAGYEVSGTTRSRTKADWLTSIGVEALVVDVFDAGDLERAVLSAKPDVVMHQLTDLALIKDAAQAEVALLRNARIRSVGTRNLVAAAVRAGASRVISQSICWVYAPGAQPHVESDRLDVEASGQRRVSVDGVVALERATLDTPGVAGTVLRYGNLYGPGTGNETAGGASPLHVDAAAHAAMLALKTGAGGVFNIAEPNAFVATAKAADVLGFDSAFRISP